MQIFREKHTGSDNDCYTAVINYSFIKSQFGELLVCTTDKGICFCAFADTRSSALGQVEKYFTRSSFKEKSDRYHAQFDKFLKDNLQDSASVNLHLKCTDFQFSVWSALTQIPFGETSTYGEIAENAGFPGAHRAAGSSIGRNPISLIIPCHRVILSNGKTGQYRWGSERKREILDWERKLKELKASQ